MTRRSAPTRRGHRTDNASTLPEVQLVTRHDLIGSTPVIGLDGDVDLGTVPLLHTRLRQLVNDHPGATVVVDLDGVTSFDDCGLGVLLGAAGVARERGGDLAVLCTQPRLRDRLRLTGLDRAVEVRDRL